VPSPILTTVGVPYGTGPDKAILHGNSFTDKDHKDYYSKKKKGQKDLLLIKTNWSSGLTSTLKCKKRYNIGSINCIYTKASSARSTHIDSKMNEPKFYSFNPKISLSGQ
jgi:hypothetical protein